MKEVNNQIPERIVNSAEALFFRYGYSKATSDEIAREAGISKRTLYKYFAGKSQLLETLINKKFHYINEEMKLILSAKIDFPEKLKKVMSIVTETLNSISLDFMEDIRKSVPDIWKRISEYKKELIENYYTSLIIEGKEAGHFKKEINTGVAVLLMISAMEVIINPPEQGSLPSEIEQKVPVQPEILFDEMLSLIYDGILVKPIK